MEQAKAAFDSAVDTVKRMTRNMGEFLEELTLQQACVIGAGVLVVVIVVANLLISFYQKYLPSMLITLVKFQFYVLIPLTAAAATVFGMYLEKRYQKFDELHDKLNEKLQKVSEMREKYD